MANRVGMIIGGVVLLGMVAHIGVQRLSFAPGRLMPEFAMKTVGGEAFGNKDVRGRVALFYVSGEG